jgi:hypothetical protein
MRIQVSQNKSQHRVTFKHFPALSSNLRLKPLSDNQQIVFFKNRDVFKNTLADHFAS